MHPQGLAVPRKYPGQVTESAEGNLPHEADPAREGLRRYERFFGRAAALSLVLAAAGFLIGLIVLSGAAEAVVLGGLGVGGLWLAAMCLVIRRRIRTGPRGTSSVGV
jgi:hypothetical protein